MICWFYPQALWFTLRQLISTACKSWQFNCTIDRDKVGQREVKREGERRDKARTKKDVDKQVEFKLKSSLWFFFHTGCSILPDTFQRHSSLKFLTWPLQISERRLHIHSEHKLNLVLLSVSFKERSLTKTCLFPSLAWSAAGKNLPVAGMSWKVSKPQKLSGFLFEFPWPEPINKTSRQPVGALTPSALTGHCLVQ